MLSFLLFFFRCAWVWTFTFFSTSVYCLHVSQCLHCLMSTIRVCFFPKLIWPLIHKNITRFQCKANSLSRTVHGPPIDFTRLNVIVSYLCTARVRLNNGATATNLCWYENAKCTVTFFGIHTLTHQSRPPARATRTVINDARNYTFVCVDGSLQEGEIFSLRVCVDCHACKLNLRIVVDFRANQIKCHFALCRRLKQMKRIQCEIQFAGFNRLHFFELQLIINWPNGVAHNNNKNNRFYSIRGRDRISSIKLVSNSTAAANDGLCGETHWAESPMRVENGKSKHITLQVISFQISKLCTELNLMFACHSSACNVVMLE